MSLIRGAIKEGFSSARKIFSGITKLDEALRDTINKTYELNRG
jgi:hypothetical protein